VAEMVEHLPSEHKVQIRKEVLCTSVEGPCLQGQVIDEPKPVCKVGFIREKGKATCS
jgi:hypothetical protein